MVGFEGAPSQMCFIIEVTYEKCLSDGGSEDYCRRVAVNAAKRLYKEVDGIWVNKSDSQLKRSGFTKKDIQAIKKIYSIDNDEQDKSSEKPVKKINKKVQKKIVKNKAKKIVIKKDDDIVGKYSKGSVTDIPINDIGNIINKYNR